MPLLVEPMTGVRSASLTWLLPAGSATDPAEREGLSTMWSEMIFRGCGELDSRGHADAMDRLGLTRSSDVSTFHLRFSATMLGERLLEALPLIARTIRSPRFDGEAVGPSRDLLLQSIESLADDPQERAMLAARERHNPPPLNRSGLGTREGLEAITREDLLAGWERQVRPAAPAGVGEGPADDVGRVGRGGWGAGGRAILAIAGAVDDRTADEAASLLDRLLAGWTGSPPAVQVQPSSTRGRYHHVPDDTSQVQVVVVHDSPAERSPDANLERVVAAVLSGGMAARLFSEVREKRGLCYSVSASYATERDYGRTLAYVGTTPERAQDSLDVLMGELLRINTPQGRVTDEEFERALVGIKSGLVFAGESTAARASGLASDLHRLGRARTLSEIAEAFDRITLDEVNGYLSRRRLGDTTIVTLGPAELKPPAA
jgi:predicted Zn-dependent peptidase